MKKQSQKGFTLIELSIVTAMIALVGMMSIPLFSRLQRTQQFRDSARSVGSALLVAKSMASTGKRQSGWAANDRVTNAGVQVLSTTSYVVFVDRDSVRDGDEIVMKTVILPRGFTIVSPVAGQEIRYRANGTVPVPQNILIRDTERNRTRTIVVAGGGAVRID